MWLKCSSRKLIGARFYSKGYLAYQDQIPKSDYKSPRDADGHGTHTASIAAGRQDPGVSYPLVYGGDTPTSPNATYCQNGTLDRSKVTGNIIICYYNPTLPDSPDRVVLELGGVGVIFIDVPSLYSAITYTDPTIFLYVLPSTFVNSDQGVSILEYVHNTR